MLTHNLTLLRADTSSHIILRLISLIVILMLHAKLIPDVHLRPLLSLPLAHWLYHPVHTHKLLLRVQLHILYIVRPVLLYLLLQLLLKNEHFVNKVDELALQCQIHVVELLLKGRPPYRVAAVGVRRDQALDLVWVHSHELLAPAGHVLYQLSLLVIVFGLCDLFLFCTAKEAEDLIFHPFLEFFLQFLYSILHLLPLLHFNIRVTFLLLLTRVDVSFGERADIQL